MSVTHAKESTVSTTFDSLVADVLADPACSYWLRDRVREALERDPLDALRDAETLVAILEARWRFASQSAPVRPVTESR